MEDFPIELWEEAFSLISSRPQAYANNPYNISTTKTLPNADVFPINTSPRFVTKVGHPGGQLLLGKNYNTSISEDVQPLNPDTDGPVTPTKYEKWKKGISEYIIVIEVKA
jgi:hypothetical protein